MLPSHNSKTELSQKLASLFQDKISCKNTTERRPHADLICIDPAHKLVAKVQGSSHVRCLQEINQMSDADIHTIIMSACVFTKCLGTLLPAITDMVNQSLEIGVFPTSLKSAMIITTLKKPSLDPEELKNFQPISNLPFIRKIMECVVCMQLMTSNSLFSSRQSANLQHHSVETALVQVMFNRPGHIIQLHVSS